MPTRDHILEEIRRIGRDIGRPPGRQVFEKASGIRPSDWHGLYWRSWGEAVAEAGFSPNTKQKKLSSDDVLRRYAEAVRHFGRMPAHIDLRMYARQHSGFPGHTTFANHFGNRVGLISAFRDWVRQRPDCHDVLPILPEDVQQLRSAEPSVVEGYVYLLRSGAYYKIGRSDQLERRVKQIAVALPNTVILEHSIRTDDPSGIEAYWHRRFSDKRRNGEWFELSLADVRAFKRRRFQ